MKINSGTKALAVAAPFIAKQVPKLWPLLLESKNRQKVMDVAGDLASQSPKRKLAGRIKVTAALAETIKADAASGDEAEVAEKWVLTARNLMIQLDMPVGGGKAKKEHLASIRQRLDDLQAQMNEHLQD